MNILVVDNGTRFMAELQQLLSSHVVRVIARQDLSLPIQKVHDLIVLSGGNQVRVLEGLEEYAIERELIRTTPVPLLGICLGFELIANAYGAPLKQMEQTRKGIIGLQPSLSHSLFAGVFEPRVYENHRWVIDQAPPEFETLATSPDGIEILHHISRPIYGFQFHPEMFPDQSQGAVLFQNFLRCVKLV